MNKGKKTGRIRVLERLGRSVKEEVSNPTPWKQQHCGRQKCQACTSKEGICKAKGAVYKIECSDCKSEGISSVYIGETHRTIWDRITEHFNLLEKQSTDSALLKHWLSHHEEKGGPPSSAYTNWGPTSPALRGS